MGEKRKTKDESGTAAISGMSTDRKRTMLRRRLLYWGGNWLETMGISLGAGLLLLIFWGVGGGSAAEGGWFQAAAFIYPCYIVIAGAFTIFMIGVAYFQAYFSLLVSMNATRKTVILDMLVNIACSIISLIAIAALIWKLLLGADADPGIALMPLFGGILFCSAALCVTFGVVALRWGKIGLIILGIMGVLLGGVLGASFAILDEGILQLITKIMDKDFRAVLAIGVVLYAAASVFAVWATKKIEVKL